MNHLKTAALLAALTALFLFVGYALGGSSGFIIALVFAVFMNFGTYWWSDKIVLRMYHAKEVTEAEVPALYSIVRELTARARLPMPKVYLIPEETPNAFATGRNPEHAAVAVTAGIMRVLSREELSAVLAHELGHVRNRDTLVATIAATIAGALSMLAQMAIWGSLFGRSSDDDEGGHPLAGLLAIFIAPIAASLLHLAISRSREFLADETGARLSGNPMALASALQKIEAWSKRIPMHSGNPATASLFIVNPLSARDVRSMMGRLFSTHPPTEARVARLEAMARRGVSVGL